jgi:thiamine biosynthesis lipoprotein
MGTLVTVSVVHQVALTSQHMVADTFAEMERLEGILSRHREETPIFRLNTEGVIHGAPVEAVHVVKKALEYSALSGGSFDVTVKPLLDLYSESFTRTGIPPSEAQVQNALSLVGHQGNPCR